MRGLKAPSFYLNNMQKILKKIEDLANAKKYDEAESLTLTSKLSADIVASILGVITMKQGLHQKSEVHFKKALQLNPNNFIALSNYAAQLLSQKKTKLALEYAERAYKLLPLNESNVLTYAQSLAESDKFKEAISLLEPFLKHEKPAYRILLTQAILCRADLRPHDALIILERLRVLYPEEPEVQKAIADAYAELDPRDASKAFNEAAKKLPNNVALEWNWAFVELRLRNFPLAWKLYENGLNEKIGKIGRPLVPQVRVFKTITELEQLDNNKWTFLVCEQGLGDQILFLGCLDEAMARIGNKVALICEERMVEIYRRSFPKISVYSYAYANIMQKQKRVNGVFPIGSLQKYFRNSVADFEKNKKIYLEPDQKLVNKYKEILRAKIPHKKLVGISWRGGHWDRQKRSKSFDFELFKLLNIKDDIHFVALQYGDVAAEKAWAKENQFPISFIDGIDFKKDLDKWFSLACACDQIVSVSTALVHYVGAAGKRVDLLIGDYQAPFIWGLEGGYSLPYSDVFIHRKNKDDSVEEFFVSVAKRVFNK